MTHVGMAGDWHGKGNWAIHALKAFKHEGITDIYHVGDFGLFSDPDGKKYIKAVHRQLELYKQRLFVTPGNHEDYVLINSLPVSDDGLCWLTDRIAIIPRGHHWDVDGRSFVSLGGAASIDYTSRKEGINWWREEAITMGDLYRIAEGGEADVMITHDAPLGGNALQGIKDESADAWLDVELAYSLQSQKMITLAVEAVRPQRLFHGHFHIGYHETIIFDTEDGGGFSTLVTGLHMNGMYKNVGVLDTESLQFDWINKPYHLRSFTG